MKNGDNSTNFVKTTQNKLEHVKRLLKENAEKVNQEYPLSYGQQALWFLYQNTPGSSAYNTAFTTRINSVVDPGSLRKAFQRVVNRHGMLRARILARDGAPYQQIQGYHEVFFEEIDAKGWDAAMLNQKVKAVYQQPFDLENGPVFKVHLFCCSAKSYVLLISLHHIVGDGLSLKVIIDDLLAFYTSEIHKTSAAITPLTLTYEDFCTYEREMLSGEEGKKHFAYWQKQLSGELMPLSLPEDKLRPAVQTFNGKSIHFKFGSELRTAISDLSKSEGVTIYTALLAAFQAFLHRYTGQQDVLVGTPIAGGDREEFRNMVGYFVNPVTIRGNFSGNPTYRSLLKQLGATVVEAIAHHSYPFPLLVERLRLKRDPSRSPLFQSWFLFQTIQQYNQGIELIGYGSSGEITHKSGLVLESFDLTTEEGQFDLILELVENKQGISGVFKYNTDLFAESTIIRMIRNFEILLFAMIADPDQCIDELPFLNGDEFNQVIEKWNNTKEDYNPGESVKSLLEAQVYRSPDSVALICGRSNITYRELNQRANRLANYLRKSGAGPEVLAGICMDRSIEMIISILAILKSGSAYVPIDPSYPRDRLDFLLTDSQVPLLITEEKLKTVLPEYNGKIICIDTEGETISLESEEDLSELATGENLIYMIYTSGSTGKPKGVMNEHNGVCNRMQWMKTHFPLLPSDRVVHKTPITFDVSFYEIFWPLMTGAQLVIADPEGHKDNQYLINLIVEKQITHIHFVPSMLQLFLEEQDVDRCSGLKHIYCTGEALQLKHQERVFSLLNAELFNFYGPTEAAIEVTFWKCQKSNKSFTIPIGRPISNTSIYILNDRRQPQPIGVPGELYIGGIAVARGYHNQEKQTIEKFILNPFRKEEKMYKTGDLARWLPDGNLEYLGRMDDQLKINGVRIEPGEVEYAIVQYPGVSGAFVTLHEIKGQNKYLWAYVVPNNQKNIDVKDLRNFLKDQLPLNIIPSKFIVIEHLPLTSNGKVDRKGLPEPGYDVKQAEPSFLAPRNYTEELIASICCRILDVKNVSVFDNFFDLGGHSLLAVQFIVRIREAFKFEIPLTSIFEKPTVSGVAEILKKYEQSEGQVESIAKLRIKISKMSEAEIKEMIRLKEKA